MANTPVQNFLYQIGIVNYDLATISGFPVSEWETNKNRYAEYWSWYSGEALSVEQNQEGRKVDKYPVKINPFRNIVAKHASALIGEVRDDDRPLAIPKASPLDRKNEPQKTAAKKIEEILNGVWRENNGRAIQAENALVSQIYGGCVFKLTYVPWENWRTYKYRIEVIQPENFIAMPDMSDSWRLSEAWIVSTVNANTAKTYGITLDVDELGTMVEYWSKTTHWQQINGMYCSVSIDGVKHQINEDNPYGQVPVFYIPHIRVGKFWGESVISSVIGLVKELNLRMADYGDAISDDSHRYVAMRNVTGSPSIVKIANGLPVINLGSVSAGLTTGNPEPDLFEVNKGSASAPMSDILDKLQAQIRRDSYTPPVSDGEDEGSQRSALTLATRFWPLTSHINLERINWSTGLDLMHRMLLYMMFVNKEQGVTQDYLLCKLRTTWSPILPKDRDSVVAEAVQRHSAELGSPQHLFELLGDIEDPDEELELIYEYIAKKAEITASIQAKYAPKPAAPSSGGGGSKSPSK